METRAIRVDERTLFIDGLTGKPIADTGSAGGLHPDDLALHLSEPFLARMNALPKDGNTVLFYVMDINGSGPQRDATVRVTDDQGREYVAGDLPSGMMYVVFPADVNEFSAVAELFGSASEPQTATLEEEGVCYLTLPIANNVDPDDGEENGGEEGNVDDEGSDVE